MQGRSRHFYANVPIVRFSDSFDKPKMATDMFEHNHKELHLLLQLEVASYARLERDVRELVQREK